MTPTLPGATATALAPLPTATITGVITSTLTPTSDITYTVVSGDTVLAIAARYETTAQAISKKNGLLNPSVIYAGQTLIIPVGYEPSEMAAPMAVQHVVKAGENLSRIARTYRTTVDDIRAQNPGIRDPNLLSPGTVLSITIGTAPAAPQVVLHTVRRGESLSSIARKYGVSVQALVRANPMPNPSRLLVGQVLVIPR